ncbi:unnamed protein product [Peniophora sp. CBMAI 1063]|nr:unnamed protein product [Peniophora sp. CBMAI 1063]
MVSSALVMSIADTCEFWAPLPIIITLSRLGASAPRSLTDGVGGGAVEGVLGAGGRSGPGTVDVRGGGGKERDSTSDTGVESGTGEGCCTTTSGAGAMVSAPRFELGSSSCSAGGGEAGNGLLAAGGDELIGFGRRRAVGIEMTELRAGQGSKLGNASAVAVRSRCHVRAR